MPQEHPTNDHEIHGKEQGERDRPQRQSGPGPRDLHFEQCGSVLPLAIGFGLFQGIENERHRSPAVSVGNI
jgi:hypothetical protein